MTSSPTLPPPPAAPQDPQYEVYGLRLGSELPLPELVPAAGDRPVDVRIARGDVDPPGPDATLLPLGLWSEADAIGFAVPGVGRFLVREGTDITVDAAPGAPDDALRLFLLGTAIGVALVQRGHLVLHGNAFAVGDGCAVVLGHSGAGKSTFAAEAHRRGLPVLSDDVVPVDDDLRALPGFARIKLWRDAADRIGLDTADLRRVRAGHEKFHVPIARVDLPPLPVRWLYVLDAHDGPLELRAVEGAEVFAHLHQQSYRREALVGEHRVRHLQRCAALGGRARLVRVLRPRGEDSVVASVDAVLADIARHGGPAAPPRPEEDLP